MNGNRQVFKNPTFQFIGLGRVFGVPWPVIIMLALVAAAAWTLRSTLFGRQILSVGGTSGWRVCPAFWSPGSSAGSMGSAACALELRVWWSCRSIRRATRTWSDRHGARCDRGGCGRGTPLSAGQATVVGTLIGALLIQLVRYTLLANGLPDAAALVVKGAIIAGAVWSTAGALRMSVCTAAPVETARPIRSPGSGGSG